MYEIQNQLVYKPKQINSTHYKVFVKIHADRIYMKAKQAEYELSDMLVSVKFRVRLINHNAFVSLKPKYSIFNTFKIHTCSLLKEKEICIHKSYKR